MSDQKVSKARLGRGLSSLLGDAAYSSKVSPEELVKNTSVSEIPVSSIEPNPYQPRTIFDEASLEELGNSIRIHGLIQPITVRKVSEGRFQILSGERRWRAAKRMEVPAIPAYVREVDNTGMLEMAIVENLQREDLNSIEIAISFQRMIEECDLKQEELAERVSKNRTTVTNYLRLLKLPPEIQLSLRDNKMSMGHARAIINVEDIDKQLFIHNRIIEKGLSVREVENWAKSQGKTKPQKRKPAQDDPNFHWASLESDLMHKFSSKVQLKVEKNNAGKIVIPFDSIEDLNRILDIISD